MGTEVLYPQDILTGRRLGSAPFHPRRRQTPCSSSSHGLNPNPNPNPNPRTHRRPESRKRREGSPKPASNGGSNGNLVMGQVTILRRGESLDSKVGAARAREEGRRGGEGAPVVLSSDAGGDLIVFGTRSFGPEPAAVPKQMRLGDARMGLKRAGRPETYAGSAFSLSPSPTSLPLPTFSSSRRAVEGGRGVVDQSATRDLRRLLRLD